MSTFIESVRAEIRVQHYRINTEKAYLGWVKRFIRFHDLKHPKEMGNTEIAHYLSYLANTRKVSSATQPRALCALIFMFKNVLALEIVGLKYGFTKKPRQLPTLLDRQQARLIISLLQSKYQLSCSLLYGSGPRINEVMQLRIKDIDYTNKTLFIYRGKGSKDGYPILLEKVIPALKDQIILSKKSHQKDITEGY